MPRLAIHASQLCINQVVFGGSVGLDITLSNFPCVKSTQNRAAQPPSRTICFSAVAVPHAIVTRQVARRFRHRNHIVRGQPCRKRRQRHLHSKPASRTGKLVYYSCTSQRINRARQQYCNPRRAHTHLINLCAEALQTLNCISQCTSHTCTGERVGQVRAVLWLVPSPLAYLPAA